MLVIRIDSGNFSHFNYMLMLDRFPDREIAFLGLFKNSVIDGIFKFADVNNKFDQYRHDFNNLFLANFEYFYSDFEQCTFFYIDSASEKLDSGIDLYCRYKHSTINTGITLYEKIEFSVEVEIK